MYKTLVDNADDLVEACDCVGVTEGVPEVKAEIQDVVDRWTSINDFYRQRRDQVSEADNKVKKYRSVLLPLENSVKKAEKTLEEPHHEGIDVCDGVKELKVSKVRDINHLYECLLQYNQPSLTVVLTSHT